MQLLLSPPLDIAAAVRSMRAQGRLLTGLRASAVLAVLCMAFALLPEDARTRLAFERSAILDGDLWRLWTAHLVPATTGHALFGSALLIAASALVEAVLGTRRVVLMLLAAAPLMAFALMAFAPAGIEYRGAAGMATMLGVVAATLLWHAGGIWTTAVVGAAVAVTASTMAATFAIASGAASLAPDAALVWQANVLGALAGIAAALLFNTIDAG